MLTAIRDKLKTWTVVLLVVLVAIPLVFLGVGDYGTNNERYAVKINDQEISKSVVLQEMGQFKDVLRKNYQGAIPPIYTNEFIKKITIDNLVRRNIENNISINANLVLSDQSIIDDINNTSSFRDDKGFNSAIYKRRLFMINMTPDTYEQYVYQKGIRDQLRKAITDTSILSIYDKKININSNYHLKIGQLLLIKADEYKDEINVTLDQINSYYESNKESFFSNNEAEFEYIRLNKDDFISSIKVTNDELLNEYNKNIKSGTYKQDDLYEINHLVFPVKDNKESVILQAEDALLKLNNNASFLDITKTYNVDDDSKANKGYLGKLTLSDMTDVLKSNILDMKTSEIKIITSESNAIHIIRFLQKIELGNKAFKDVKAEILKKVSHEKGSKEYYLTLDNIKNKIYSEKKSLKDISKLFSLQINKTPKIDNTFKDKILTNDILQQLFLKMKNTELFSPIYRSNDDVLFVRKVVHYPPKQLKLKDTEAAIRALLTTQTRNDKLNKLVNNKLKVLNEGSIESYERFRIYNYENKYSDEIMNIINNQPITSKFVSNKLNNGDYLLLRITSFEESIDKEKVEADNFLDFLENTQSEGDYNNLYITKYNNFSVDVNNNYLNQ